MFVTSFAETEELKDDSLGSSCEGLHAVLQLLVSPLECVVQGPQVLDGRRVEIIVLRQPCIECFEFICRSNRKEERVTTDDSIKYKTMTSVATVRHTAGPPVETKPACSKKIVSFLSCLLL